MEQRVSLVTLGVDDLARAKAFYERLGWRGQELSETVFFQTGGSAFVLWGREALARDCGLPVGTGSAASASRTTPDPRPRSTRSSRLPRRPVRW
ncbi:hypothetical protein [Saccharopolyspora gregorii]|uniref:VOC family protein n=1 Tax=Saccharopolyspora gregorii TaxID=33914 RepID=UPI0031E92798